MPLTLRRLSQKDLKFEASLDYIARQTLVSKEINTKWNSAI
jgi:hypothetical protein